MSSTHKAVVVDFNLSNQKIYSNVLNNCGYKMIEAYDCNEGINACRANGPDLIIVDTEVSPYQDDEFIVHLRSEEKTQNTPIIAVINCENKHNIYSCDENTVIVRKPFVIEKFIDLIKNIKGNALAKEKVRGS